MKEIKLVHEGVSATINYHGAELRSLKKNDNEYMWQADPKYWNRTSPVLFPFVGAVADGVYRVNGTEYKMGQHGFARDMEFELVESAADSCKFALVSNDETMAKYPYNFKLCIGYQLFSNGIKVIWEVENTGDEKLQFSIGAHPAFNCTLSETQIRIMKNGKGVSKFTNSVFGKGLLTDKKADISLADGVMKLDEHSFDGDAYVIENSQTDRVEILDASGNFVLAVSYSSPLVGIWSPPGKNAPFMCIEPWYGRADKEGFLGDISEREWNNTLAPSEKFACDYMIEI